MVDKIQFSQQITKKPKDNLVPQLANTMSKRWIFYVFHLQTRLLGDWDLVIIKQQVELWDSATNLKYSMIWKYNWESLSSSQPNQRPGAQISMCELVDQWEKSRHHLGCYLVLAKGPWIRSQFRELLADFGFDRVSIGSTDLGRATSTRITKSPLNIHTKWFRYFLSRR